MAHQAKAVVEHRVSHARSLQPCVHYLPTNRIILQQASHSEIITSALVQDSWLVPSGVTIFEFRKRTPCAS